MKKADKKMYRNETMTVKETAALLGMDQQTLRIAIERKQFSWATCIKAGRKRYIIYRQRFETETGIKTEPKGGTK